MAKKRLPPEFTSAIDQVLASNPDLYDAIIPMVEEKGFDASTINRPSGIQGDVWDEAAALLSGFPEGFFYNVYEAESAGEHAATVDAPLVGEIQPSREIGRLLGGMVSGGALYGLGLKTVGRVAGRATMKGLAKRDVGSKRFRKIVSKTLAAAASGSPEALTGSIATAIRTGDLEAGVRAFPEWMALGLGSDALFAGVRKLYRRSRAGASIAQGDRERLAQQVERELDPSSEGTVLDVEHRAIIDEDGNASIIHDQPVGGDDAKRFAAIADPEDPWLSEKLPISAYGAEFGTPAEAKVYKRAAGRKISAALSEAEQRGRANQVEPIHPTQQGPNGELVAVTVEDQVERLSKDLANDIRIHDKAVGRSSEYKNSDRGRRMVARMRDKDLTLRNLRNEMPRDPDKEYFKGLEVVRGPIGGGVTARYLREKQQILIDDDVLRTLFKNKGWRKSKIEGVNSLGANAFKNEAELEEFILKHEWLHSLISFDEYKLSMREAFGARYGGTDVAAVKKALVGYQDITRSDYENFINRMTHDFDAHTSKPVEGTGLDIDPITKGRIKGIDDPDWVVPSHIAPEEPGTYSKQVEEKLGDTPHRGEELPFEGGTGPAPVNLRAEIAGLMEDVRRKMPHLSINPKILLPDNINLEQATIIRDNMVEIQYWSDVMKHDRLAQQLDMEGPGIVELPIDVQAAVVEVGEDIAQGPGWFSRIVGPFSRNGLGANRLTKWYAEETMQRMDEKQAMLGEWLKEYLEIRKLMGVEDKGIAGRVQNIARRAVGGADPDEAARMRLFEMARVLDDRAALPVDWDANMKQGYQRYKAMMVDVANKLDLPRDRRIGEYLHHLFAGRTGRYRATQLSSQLSDDPGKAGRLLKKILAESTDETKEETLEQHVRDLLDSVQREAPEITPRGFRALLKRKGAEEYEFDLDQITRLYLMGASEKWFSNQVFPRAQGVLMHLPDRDLMGNPTRLRREFAEYVNHLMGRSTERRQRVAAWFGQNSLFNRGFDRMVEDLGGGKRGTLSRGRKEADSGIDGEAQAAATEFLDELDGAARIYDKQTGEMTKSSSMKAMRARLAIRLEDMRQALANPGISGPVANQLYRVQIMAKLGLNAAHGMINMTQTYVNTWPLLKKGYTSRAIVNHWFKGSGRKIKGYDVDDLLEQSGIRGDASKVEEYIELHGTWLGDVQNFVMAPSKMSEQFNRSVAFLGFYEQVRDEGLEHLAAVRKAVSFVQKTQFPFNRAGTPPLLRGPMVRLAFMFKSYPIHQTDFSYNLLSDAYGSVKAGRAEGKTLAEALETDDVISAAKHIFAYTSMIGAGYALFPDLNLAERNIPAVFDLPMGVAEGMGRYGALGSLAHELGGPFNETVRRSVMAADSGLDFVAALAGIGDQSAGEAGTDMLRHGVRAASSFMEPTSVRKLRENGFPESNDDWLQLLSLKAYHPKKAKPKMLRMSGL